MLDKENILISMKNQCIIPCPPFAACVVHFQWEVVHSVFKPDLIHRLKQRLRWVRRARWVPMVCEEEQEPLDWRGGGGGSREEAVCLALLAGALFAPQPINIQERCCLSALVSAAASSYPRCSSVVFVHSVHHNLSLELETPDISLDQQPIDAVLSLWHPNRPWPALISCLFDGVPLQSEQSPPVNV